MKDFSNSVGLSEEPSNRNLQRLGDGRHFIVHEIAGLALHAGNCGLVHGDPFSSEPSGQILLGNWRDGAKPGLSDSLAYDVSLWTLAGLFHWACELHMLDFYKNSAL